MADSANPIIMTLELLARAIDINCPNCGLFARIWMSGSIIFFFYWIAAGIYWALHFAVFLRKGAYEPCAPWTWMYPKGVVSGEFFSMIYTCNRMVATMLLHVMFGFLVAMIWVPLFVVVAIERLTVAVEWFGSQVGDSPALFSDSEDSETEKENKGECEEENLVDE